MDKRVSNKLHIYSLVMAFIITLFHFGAKSTLCFDVINLNPYDEFVVTVWGNILSGLAGMAVGYFFMSSAFLFYYNLTSGNITEKLKRRFIGLIVPYVSWNMIAFFVEVLLTGVWPSYEGEKILIEKLLLDPYDGPLWFIVVLIIYLLFSPIMIKLKERPRGLWFGLILMYLLAFVYCAGGYYKIFPVWPLWVERFVRYMPVYFTGAVIGLTRKEWVLQSKLEGKGKYFRIIWLMMFGVIGAEVNSYLSWIFTEVIPIVAWLAFDKKKFEGNVGEYLKISFLIFASHAIGFKILHAMCRATIGTTWTYVSGTSSVWIQLLAIPIAYGFGCILHFILKHIPKLYKGLVGNR